MTHDAEATTDDLAVLYVLGELSPDERTAFERQMASDAALAAEVGRLRNTFELLPYGNVTPPPAGLRDRVMAAAVAEAEPVPQPARSESAKVVPFPVARPARRIVWSRFAAAAAAVLALALGIDSWRVRQELSLQRDVTALLSEPNVVHTFDLAGKGGAFARVSLDMDAKKGALVAHNLPPLPAGQVYRLWAAVGDKSVECGQFNAPNDGVTKTQFAVPVESYTAPIGKLFVTVEPTAPTPTPTGPTVMESTPA
jgi:anti-sigma-K factor RskA